MPRNWDRNARLVRLYLFQCPFEEIHYSGVQLACLQARHRMRLLRVELHLERLTRALQRTGHLDGVLEQHVVVLHIVRDHQLPFKVLGLHRQGRVLVAVRIVLGQTHVALGIDAVVIMPIGYGCASDTGLENARGIQKRVEGHKSAVTPSADSDARPVHDRLEAFVSATILQVGVLFAATLGFMFGIRPMLRS